MQDQIRVPQKYLDLINQIYEIDKKVGQLKEANSIYRNLNKIKEMLENEIFNSDFQHSSGFIYHDPIGEAYNETRTDCEASISGVSTENLEIVEVIKPIIFLKRGGIKNIVQKAVVVVKSKPIS